MSWIIGLVIGAAAMYLLDPERGNRRRALLRDQVTKLSNRAQDRAEALHEQASDRAQGVVAEASKRMESGPVSDEVLAARVRSEMGRYVSTPGAIQVSATNGVVTLRGNILMREAQPLVNHVRMVPGVRSVNNEMQQHDKVGDVPDLQGGRSQ